MRHLMGGLLVSVLAIVPACDKSVGQWPRSPGGEVVPAGPEPDPGDSVAARYWVEVNPMTASWKSYRIYPGNVIYRDGINVEAVTYNYSNTITINESTPQTAVTYVSSTGACFSDGAAHTPCPDPSWPTLCQANRAFCGPVVAINNSANLLPDPVVAITSVSGANSINSCGNSDGGRCAQNGDKVTSFNMTSTPVVSTCAYCYGNNTKASGACAPGLADAMRVNDSSGTLLDVNTDEFVMNLANDSNFQMVITTRYAVPSASGFVYCGSATGRCNHPPTCLTSGSTSLQINGTGFGVAGECYSNNSCPSTWCPVTGGLVPPGSSVTFTGASGAITANVNTWADQRVFVQVPTGAIDGPVTITTPQGTASVTVNICP